MVEIVNSLILLANLGVLGLNLKLYTEILKDKSQDRRATTSAAQQAEQGREG